MTFSIGHALREARLLFTGMFGPGTEQNETPHVEDLDGLEQDGQRGRKNADVRDRNVPELLMRGPEETERPQEKKEAREEDPDELAERGAAEAQRSLEKPLAEIHGDTAKREARQDLAVEDARAEREAAEKRGRLSTTDVLVEGTKVATTAGLGIETPGNTTKPDEQREPERAASQVASVKVENPETRTAVQTSEEVRAESLSRDSQGGAGEEAEKAKREQVRAGGQEGKLEQVST